MKSLTIAALSAALLMTTSAFAQTSPPATSPTNPSAPASVPSAIERSSAEAPILNEQQAKDWINKVVYSSDNTKVGEVAAFARDATGKVTEMHADIGGFMGLGETRVRVMPAQFKLSGDRVVLVLNAEQVKALPQLPK